MIVHCDKCGGGRKVTFTEYDSFRWQCPKCNTPHWHEGKPLPIVKPLKEEKEEEEVKYDYSEEEGNEPESSIW